MLGMIYLDNPCRGDLHHICYNLAWVPLVEGLEASMFGGNLMPYGFLGNGSNGWELHDTYTDRTRRLFFGT